MVVASWRNHVVEVARPAFGGFDFLSFFELANVLELSVEDVVLLFRDAGLLLGQNFLVVFGVRFLNVNNIDSDENVEQDKMQYRRF